MNKPYTCHIEGCAPCVFDLVDDVIQGDFEKGLIPYPKKVKVTCHGAGSCNQTYIVDVTTMQVVAASQ